MSSETRTIATARGVNCDVQVRGADRRGTPVVFMHSVAGLFAEEPLLDALAEQRPVFAPLWPGYGETGGDDVLEDMLDFTLHGWDVVAALGLDRPHVIGHGFGGMIAAEMACIAPTLLASVALLAPYGLWIDAHPLPDLFTVSPFDVPKLLFADADRGSALLAGGRDFADSAVVTDFMVANARRLGMAGKVLFPIPNRRLSKRLYRLATPSLVVWGTADQLIPADPYARRWQAEVPHARLVTVPGAGHQLGHDAPDAVRAAVETHLVH